VNGFERQEDTEKFYLRIHLFVLKKISVNNVLTFEHTQHRICIFELLWRNLLELYWQFHCISVSLLEH